MNWNIENMVEVRLKSPEDFLKVKETLTRIGVASKKEKKLFQSCHILHKREKYYIVMFKELFLLDGKTATLTENDLARRNKIIELLEEWGLLIVVDKEKIQDLKASLSQIKVISFREKEDWELVPKYSIGKTSSDRTEEYYGS